VDAGEAGIELAEVLGRVPVRLGMDRRRASFLQGDKRRCDVRDGDQPTDAGRIGSQDPSVAAPYERDPVALRIRMPTGWWELDVDDRLRDDILGDSRNDVCE